MKKNKNYKSKEKISEEEEKENITKYGEFVSSYFAWVGPEKQKERGNELENITKK